jgi:proliferating cell nuclear antigen
MFVAKLEKAEPLKKITNAFTEVMSNIEWRITEDGIRIYAMDVSHVCVIDFNVPKTAFLSYTFNTSEHEPLRVCVPFNNLAKVLKCVGSDQSMYIKILNQQHMILTCTDKDGNAREFKLALLECVDDIPDLELPDEDNYNVTAKFEPNELAALIKDMSSIGETIKIEGVDDSLRFTTSGEIGTASISFKKITIQEDGSFGAFASRYMTAMSKMSTASEEQVVLCISPQMPMMVKFNIINGFGCVRYFIAPKVIDDDDNDDHQDD